MLQTLKVMNKSDGTITVLDTGNINIMGTSISVDTDDNNISMSTSEINPPSSPYDDYMKSLETRLENNSAPFPYLRSISGVKASDNGSVWILGGKSSQVSFARTEEGEKFLVSDMSQTVDYPRIYRSVYSMLREIRLWLDAHKDTLLLRKLDAEDQWNTMKNDPNDWRPSATESGEEVLMYSDSRERSEIKAIGDATNFIPVYQGTVALWNHIVGTPASKISTRLHPADSAGLYIGINVVVPMIDNEECEISINLHISIDGQKHTPKNNTVQGSDSSDSIDYGDFMLWLRSPSQATRSIPSGASIYATLPGDSAVSATEPSILDDSGKQIILDKDIDIQVKATIPGGSSKKTSYTIQTVIELIPFFRCGNEVTYADSKKSSHYPRVGENTWTIAASVMYNDEMIQELRTEKKTPYAQECVSYDDEEE